MQQNVSEQAKRDVQRAYDQNIADQIVTQQQAQTEQPQKTAIQEKQTVTNEQQETEQSEETQGRKSLKERMESGEVMEDGAEQTYDNLLEFFDDNEEDVKSAITNKIADLEEKIKKAKSPKSADIDKIKAARQKATVLQMQLDYWKQVAQIPTDRKQQKEYRERKEKEVAQQRNTNEEQQQNQEQIKENSQTNTAKEKYNAGEKVVGRETSYIMPDGTELKGRYVVVEADSLTPSHDARRSFVQNEGFPINENGSTMNSRDYARQSNEQAKVIRIATKYDKQAVSNPPIVDSNGVVLSGNGRTMAGQYASMNGTDSRYNEYLQEISERDFGISGEEVKGMQHPRVVIELDEDIAYTTENFDKFNKTQEEQESTTARAVKVTKILKDKPNIIRRIGDWISELAEKKQRGGIESRIIRNGSDIVNLLLHEGILQPNETTQYLNGDGSLNGNGTEFIRDILLGACLDEKAVSLVKRPENSQLRDVILNSINEILDNKLLGEEYTLNDDINKAIEVVTECLDKGITIADFFAQTTIFDNRGLQGKTTQLLAEKLNKEDKTAFKDILSLYNNSARNEANGENLFGDKRNREDILTQIIARYGQQDETTSEQVNDINVSRETTTSTQRQSEPNAGGSERDSVANAERGNEEIEVDEVEPIGTNKWGNIYQGQQGKAKEYAHLLEKEQSGYVKDVFYNNELGNIDLNWGNEKGGLKHIIDKHINKRDDFTSLDEAIDTIENVLANGKMTEQGTNRSFDYGGYRVSVAQSNEGNWVITAFDKTRSKENKEKKPDTTIGDQSIAKKENGTLVSPDLVSDGKDTTTSETDKESRLENKIISDKEAEALEKKFNDIDSKANKIKQKAINIIGGIRTQDYNNATEEQRNQFDKLKEKYNAVRKLIPLEKLVALEYYASYKVSEFMVDYEEYTDNHSMDNIAKELAKKLNYWSNLLSKLITYRSELYNDERFIIVPTSYIIKEREKETKKKQTERIGNFDNQGNPIDENGKLITEKVNSIDEITDEDFTNPTRSVELPNLPDKVANVLGTNGKPVVIKKNVFERNTRKHKDVTPEDSREILNKALYSPNLYGQNQKSKRPNNWVVINIQDRNGINKLVLLEVNSNKDNIEIIHWYYTDERGIEKVKRQAEREDGQLFILPSENSEEVGALSNPTSDLSDGKGTTNSETDKEKSKEKEVKDNYYFTYDLIPDGKGGFTYDKTKNLYKQHKKSATDKAKSEKNNKETALVEALEDVLSDAGIEVITDNEEAQRVLDRANGNMLSEVNKKFNEELEQLTTENADNVQLNVGRPSNILLACGMPNRAIVLYGNKLVKKAKQHGYDFADIKDLPKYVANPIAVFKGSYENSFAILTEMPINGKNALVSIDISKGEVQDVNLVTSVFDKNSKGVINWINNGKLIYAEKNKVLDYLSTSVPITDATNKQELNSVAKILQNFENPIIKDGKINESREKFYSNPDFYTKEYQLEESEKQYKKATEVVEALKKAGMPDFHISRSMTNHGVSTYIIGYGAKFRISDHSVTSIHRIKEEEFFNFDTPASDIVAIAQKYKEIQDKRK